MRQPAASRRAPAYRLGVSVLAVAWGHTGQLDLPSKDFFWWVMPRWGRRRDHEVPVGFRPRTPALQQPLGSTTGATRNWRKHRSSVHPLGCRLAFGVPGRWWPWCGCRPSRCCLAQGDTGTMRHPTGHWHSGSDVSGETRRRGESISAGGSTN